MIAEMRQMEGATVKTYSFRSGLEAVLSFQEWAGEMMRWSPQNCYLKYERGGIVYRWTFRPTTGEAVMFHPSKFIYPGQ